MDKRVAMEKGCRGIVMWDRVDRKERSGGEGRYERMRKKQKGGGSRKECNHKKGRVG